MDTSVKLQDMLSFSKIPIYVVVGLLAIIFLYFLIPWLIQLCKKKRIQAGGGKTALEKKKSDSADARQVYLELLDALERDFNQGICDIRCTYQRMSVIIRDFVYEMTGIKVQNYTLRDIRKIRMPILEELVEEYYSPEFAQKSEGDVKASLDKTRNAIKNWGS